MASIHVCRSCGRRDTRHRSQLCGYCLRGIGESKAPRPRHTKGHEPVEDDYGEESSPDSVALDSPELRAVYEYPQENA